VPTGRFLTSPFPPALYCDSFPGRRHTTNSALLDHWIPPFGVSTV